VVNKKTPYPGELPDWIKRGVDVVLKDHPEYLDGEKCIGECVNASDELLFKLDEFNNDKPIDGGVDGEPVDCIIDGKPSREPHHWAKIRDGNIEWNIDLTARQFDINADCPKIWKVIIKKKTMSKLDQLKNQIKQQLDLCDSTETPTICAIKNTPDGYADIEKMVIDKVLYGPDPSIANAIVEIENTYNINSTDQ
jgi:hypothetical protein